MRIGLFFWWCFAISCWSCGTAASNSSGNTEGNSSSEDKISVSKSDSLIFFSIIQELKRGSVEHISPAECMIPVARHFEGTPYVAHTLEAEGEEHLVVNLKELDCTTFVEVVLAISIYGVDGTGNMDDFFKYLKKIRYRDGSINRYPSRLHYFTEWLQNNQDKGILEIVSNELGNEEFNSEVHFMTSNSHLYPKLKNHPEQIKEIRDVEQRISDYRMRYITKDRIDDLSHLIKDGDIIAFTTNIEGLDVSHTGMAIHLNDQLFLIHASSISSQVEITPVPLSQYLKNINHVNGILVARVLPR